jgi:hypothetical protein
MATDDPPRGWVPIPDPTKLTTDAVERARVDIEKIIDLRFDAMTKLFEEKFAGRDLALTSAFKSQQELYKQQNDFNTVAADKAERATGRQIDTLITRLDDIKDSISELKRRDWTTVGAYIMGAIGIAALIIAAIIHRPL